MSAMPTPRTIQEIIEAYEHLPAACNMAILARARELEAKLSSAAADKRRLDWLEENFLSVTLDIPIIGGGGERQKIEQCEILRAAIDAALSAETKPES